MNIRVHLQANIEYRIIRDYYPKIQLFAQHYSSLILSDIFVCAFGACRDTDCFTNAYFFASVATGRWPGVTGNTAVIRGLAGTPLRAGSGPRAWVWKFLIKTIT